MTMRVASEHIQAWIRTGKGFALPVEIAGRFGQYLDGLPWCGTGLDWSRITGKKLALGTLNEEQMAAWLASVPIGQDPYLVFMYAPDEPCLACESAFAFANLIRHSGKLRGSGMCSEDPFTMELSSRTLLTSPNMTALTLSSLLNSCEESPICWRDCNSLDSGSRASGQVNQSKPSPSRHQVPLHHTHQSLTTHAR
jgi:hypothetical protein